MQLINTLASDGDDTLFSLDTMALFPHIFGTLCVKDILVRNMSDMMRLEERDLCVCWGVVISAARTHLMTVRLKRFAAPSLRNPLDWVQYIYGIYVQYLALCRRLGLSGMQFSVRVFRRRRRQVLAS